MNLHTDLPTRAQVDQLLRASHPSTVSIYLPTAPASDGEAERIELKNLAAEARRQLEEAGHPASAVAAIEPEIAELDGDRILAPSGAEPRDLRDSRDADDVPVAQ